MNESPITEPSANTSEIQSYVDLFDQHSAQMLGLLRLRGCSFEDAEDILQDIALSLFPPTGNGIESFQSDRQFLPWLKRIVINRSIDACRRKHRNGRDENRTISLGDCDDWSFAMEDRKSVSPVDVLIEQERRLIVESGLERVLGAQVREDVRLRLQGFKYNEIAQQRNRPAETVRWAVYYSINLLRSDPTIARFAEA